MIFVIDGGAGSYVQVEGHTIARTGSSLVTLPSTTSSSCEERERLLGLVGGRSPSADRKLHDTRDQFMFHHSASGISRDGACEEPEALGLYHDLAPGKP
ncbi:hypothetical protein LVO79_18350 (plasmid) [Roseivivax marinus]|uniref:hypothetical protein n=1 Tax=Roseivivax marinus TaxID=1379903 RepID=UPI001F04E308|nr:hypothetical protein [Roseivivax marinus]UMA67193.1 hypothetical protein LVO79_18350 [Roseivivax marinus]